MGTTKINANEPPSDHKSSLMWVNRTQLNINVCIPWCIKVIYQTIFRGINIVLRASEYLGQSVPDLCFSIPLPSCLHKTLCSAPIATAIVWDHISMLPKGTLFCTGLSEKTVGKYIFLNILNSIDTEKWNKAAGTVSKGFCARQTGFVFSISVQF